MVTYSKSFKDFLRSSRCRVAQILFNYYATDYKAYELMITTKQIDYITFRSDGTISYLPAGKEHKVNEDGEWSRAGRQNGAPGKVIRKLFTPKALKILKDKDFECFTNDYKAEFTDGSMRFELWDNKKVVKAYSMDRAEGGSTLSDSCMHGNEDDDEWREDWLDIYYHCKYLKILVLLNDDEQLCGRALVWHLADGVTIMDRIYVAKDFMYDMFKKHAADKGWLRKYNYNSKDDKTKFVTPDGEVVYKKIRIITDVNHDYYPYIDTFTYGDRESLMNYCDSSHIYTYDNADGTRDGEDEDDHSGESYDEIDGDYINEDDAVVIDKGQKRGQITHRNNVVEINGSYWWREDRDIVQLSYDDEWYLREDVVYSERDSEDYPESECVYTVDQDWILRDDATEIDGKWYHDDDVVYSNYCKDNFVKADCVYSKPLKSWILEEDAVMIEGEYYHVDELPEEEREKSFVDIDDRPVVTNDPNQISLF